MSRFAESTIRAIRYRLADERGFGLIEVLVAAVVVGLAVVGVFTALDAANATSSRNKARNVAANLAEADQERLRGMKVADLSNLRESNPKTVDGGTYTVSSETDWVSDTSGTVSCTSTDSRTDYLKLTTIVTSRKLGSIKPVTAESIQAVPNGTFGATQGSVVVQITDRNGNGVPGLSVALAGAQSYAETTNANGCVIFGFVPVGTYTVSFSRAGWVESTYPNRQDISDSVVVAGEQSSRKAYMYDAAGSVSVRFKDSAGNPVNGDRFTVSHAQLTPINAKVFSGGPATTLPGDGLFPFSSSYSVWAGGCATGNPTTHGQAANQPAPVTPGGPATAVDVVQPTLTVNLTNLGAAGGSVFVKPTVPGCARDESRTISGASGTVTIALPYGPYTVCGQRTSPPRFRTASPTNKLGAPPISMAMGAAAPSGTCP